jgi:hypothetical protein
VSASVTTANDSNKGKYPHCTSLYSPYIHVRTILYPTLYIHAYHVVCAYFVRLLCAVELLLGARSESSEVENAYSR